MSPETLLNVNKDDKLWIYYNIVNQTMVETSLTPGQLEEKLPQNIKDKLFFATDEEKLIFFNRELYKKIRLELTKEKDHSSHFAPSSQLVIVLWYDCNFKCPYCYQRFRDYREDKLEDLIDKEKLKKFLVQKSEGGKYPPRNIDLIGGEPLLNTQKHKEVFLQIIEMLGTLFTDVGIHIITNGYTLDEFLPIFLRFPKIHWKFTVTLGVNEKQHSIERVSRREPEINSFGKIISNLERIKKELSNCNLVIRFNLADDFDEGEETIKLMTELKSRLEEVIFEISPIYSPTSHFNYSSSFVKFLRKLLTLKTFTKSLIFKIPPQILHIIRNSISEKKQSDVNIQVKLCNAIYFETNYDLSPSFNVQPCEDFRFYIKGNKNDTHNISKTALSNLDSRVEECISCPHFQFCISNPCLLQKRKELKLEQCYNQENYSYLIPIQILY